METTADLENLLSSKQKGKISENRVAEIISLSSRGNLTGYVPSSDDDGIDLIVNPKGAFKPIFIQIKSRFKLQDKGQFIQNVGLNTFNPNECFYLLFIYFNEKTLEIDKLWFVPSINFFHTAYIKEPGETYKSFFRFSANPNSKKDRWAKYSVDKSVIGIRLIEIINSLYNKKSMP